MNPQDALQQLRDIQLPADPHWWPPAPGWWVLAAFLLLIIYFAVKLWQRYRLWQRPARLAIQQLGQLEKHYLATRDQRQFVQQASVLTRQFVLFTNPRQDSAASDSDWLNILDGLCGANGFSKQAGQILIEAPYRRTVDVNIQVLANELRQLFSRYTGFRLLSGILVGRLKQPRGDH